MRVILLFLARVSVSFRRLSNLNPTAEPTTKASKLVTGLETMLGKKAIFFVQLNTFESNSMNGDGLS